MTIDTLPWIVQLVIGIGLLLSSAGINLLGKRLDSDLLELGAMLLGFIGIFAIIGSVFPS